MPEIISLVEMNTGDIGTVVGFEGGFGMIRKLENMGIRIGSQIKKVSGQFGGGGPVVISQGSTQVAIGFGMAKRIMVKIDA